MTIPRIRGGYPAEKPPEVADVLITQSSQPGDVVVDPFMGSGSVGVAALRTGRRFLGNDLNAEAVKIAEERLRTAGEPEPKSPTPDPRSPIPDLFS
jgi:site-specific DNA-methyltransferase (adenine-specific)